MTPPRHFQQLRELQKRTAPSLDEFEHLRVARKATNEVFRSEEVRINVALIGLIQSKIEICKKLFVGLNLALDQMFLPHRLNSASLRELVELSREVVEQIMTVSGSLEETKKILSEMVPLAESTGAERIFKDLSGDSVPVESRKRLNAAYRLIVLGVQQKIGENPNLQEMGEKVLDEVSVLEAEEAKGTSDGNS